MSDPVMEAAQALTPLLAAGADGVLAETARQAGAEGAKALRRVLDSIREALGGSQGAEAAEEEAVATALRRALQEGAITDGDVHLAVNAVGAGRDNYGVQVKGNSYIGNSIKVEGGNFNG